MPDFERAVSRFLVLHDGGAWDYFPFGLKKPGYRVSVDRLREAVQIEREISRRSLILVLVLGFLLYIALPELARFDPRLSLAASSPIFQLAVAIPVLAAIYLFVMAERRRKLRALLRAESPTCLPLSPSEILTRRASDWRGTPWFARLTLLIATPLMALALALYAYGHAREPDELARMEAGLAALLALGVAVLYLLFIGRLARFYRLRSTRH